MTMNVSRLCMDGTMHPDETLNKSQIFVTTAGWKNTFARLKKFVGELKPCEPQNEGVDFLINLLTVKAQRCVTLCQAIFLYGRFRDYRKHLIIKEVSRVGLR